jgi:hypothetical protein
MVSAVIPVLSETKKTVRFMVCLGNRVKRRAAAPGA